MVHKHLPKDLNTNTQLLPKNDFDQKKESNEEKASEEKKGMLFVAFAALIFGFNSFHMKFINVIAGKDFIPILFLFWRNVSIILISYIMIYKDNVEIKDVRTVNNKFWLFVRTIGNYLSFFCFISSLLYIRITTTVCINSMNPAIVIVLSTFILKEKFYVRYILGIFICVGGTMLIVLNEKKPNKPTIIIEDLDVEPLDLEDIENIIPKDLMPNDDLDFLNKIIGLFYACSAVFFLSMLIVASKMLLVEKINYQNQCLFVGISNTFIALISILITGEYNFNMVFALHSGINGVLFYVGTASLLKGYHLVEISKTTPLTYLTPIFALILGFFLLGEQLYFLDLIGCGIIIGYNLINTLYPPK